ncbi:hypothetical protein DICVIV_06208 [Dictyocaulus viviparus]|uniref:Histidine acid phosphatase n=1 Tax=Dictyocaulus viviparus TaxID=29172 RepID=A0A0D8XV89_DICVI|nr:hypothetical protein DICVIV_06208 [Dictyocaulus viviparus]
MTQPNWLTPEISRRLRNLTELLNGYTYGIATPYLPELIRLRGGSMLRSIVDLMGQKLHCLSVEDRKGCDWIRPLKYYAYSAHDTTVAALLATFGDELEVIRGGLPKYTASVAVELWMLEEEPFVRLFVKRSRPFMPINIKEECQQRGKNKQIDEEDKNRELKEFM